MKSDAAQITKLARDTGFPADNLEKVLRLRELLTELHKHPFLQGKLVLKGGTALNLFYLDLARLSVDIDLNYIAHIDREGTLRERPEIVGAIEQVTTGLKYKLQNGVDEHALREWYLNYPNHTGKSDRIQIEVNFLMRACALPPKLLAAATLAGAPPSQFLVLETEELFGGKIKAMIDRRHPRDLYDLFRFTKTNLKHNPDILRKLAVLFASTMDRDFRTYAMDRFDAIDPKELERLLYPLLRADDRPTAPEMLKAVSPLLATVLDHKREAEYLEAMAAGLYRPELLFPHEAAIVGRIQQHPALLWKADNVAQHLSRSKKNS
jgi:predicted nucleotidyltransferase component of viral defense system